MADETGRDPATLEPLYEAIDPDALDMLFKCRQASNGRVTFRYAGCVVVVSTDGVLVVAVD